MDERLALALFTAAGTAAGMVLGGLLGALTGALHWASGRAAGTRFGLAVADAFTRAAGQELSRGLRGAIVGAADGVLFLGIVGTLVGFFLARGHIEEQNLWPIAWVALFLLGLAVFFGMLAYTLVRNGSWAILCVSVGGVVGTGCVLTTLGPSFFLLGLLPGLLAGMVLSFVGRRYAPEFRSPRVGHPTPRRGRDSGSDVTRRTDTQEG
jgi:hypothetical protein